jgi:hypothetical protein
VSEQTVELDSQPHSHKLILQPRCVEFKRCLYDEICRWGGQREEESGVGEFEQTRMKLDLYFEGSPE